jgi:hypothetical protein
MAAETALYRYLNPYVGGPYGNGWPFGRSLNHSEIYSLLQDVEHVEFVENVRVSTREQKGTATSKTTQAVRKVELPPHGLICSDQHEVRIV